MKRRREFFDQPDRFFKSFFYLFKQWIWTDGNPMANNCACVNKDLRLQVGTFSPVARHTVRPRVLLTTPWCWNTPVYVAKPSGVILNTAADSRAYGPDSPRLDCCNDAIALDPAKLHSKRYRAVTAKLMHSCSVRKQKIQLLRIQVLSYRINNEKTFLQDCLFSHNLPREKMN